MGNFLLRAKQRQVVGGYINSKWTRNLRSSEDELCSRWTGKESSGKSKMHFKHIDAELLGEDELQSEQISYKPFGKHKLHGPTTNPNGSKTIIRTSLING